MKNVLGLRERYFSLDEDHNLVPCDMMTWARGRNGKVHRVAYDVVGEAKVSTVFLGLDHGWGEGPPVVFETMVFGGPLDQEQVRYATWAEAVAGHADMLARAIAANGD